MFKILKTAFWVVLGTGLAIALLGAFGGDPFAVLEWAFSFFVSLVTRISDWISGNSTFQDLTEAPAIIRSFF